MRRLSMISLLAAVGLTACGGSSQDATTSPPDDVPASASPTTAQSSPAPSPSASEPAQPDPAARRTLRDAQRAVAEANTGIVRTVVELGPVRTETVAHYDLRSRSMRSEGTITAPDERLVMDAVVIGEDAWFRITRPDGDDARQSCWMNADPDVLEAATGLEAPQGSGRGIPAGLMVALTATGQTQLDPDRAIGRIDLYTLATAFSGKLALLLGLDFDTKGTAPVVIQLDAGVVTGWRSSLVDLLGAVEDAGLQLPPEAQGYEDASLADASVDAQVSDLGTPVSITPPPADQVVDLVADEEQAQQAMQACEARQG